MFLITGAGRSGTKYIATVLRKCGLDVGHEGLGESGIVSGFYCFDADWYPNDRHPVPRPQFDLILHQVRHPLRVIASMQTTHSWEWACQFLPIDESAPLLQRCCYNWLIPNETAERQAAFTYRIENLEGVWSELQRLIGFDASYKIAASLPNDINSRPHGNVTWNDVQKAVPEAYSTIVNAAERYGYQL